MPVERCPNCKGLRLDTCDVCLGSGQNPEADENTKPAQRKCNRCHGSGQMSCLRCNGTGIIDVKQVASKQ